MRIFIDIGHPAHVHYFKNFIHIMIKKGHSFFVTSRNKEMAQYLLEKEKIPFVDRGSGKDSVLGKIFYMLRADFFILKHAFEFKTDIFLGFASFYTAHVSFFLRKPSIILDDTENGNFQQLFYLPFANAILSPSTFSKNFGKRHIKFESYLELSYLHPKYFTPDFKKISDLGVKKGEKYTICRFVSWQANHDFGHNGISKENKILAVKEFLKYGKVFISSECELPDEIKKYQINLDPAYIHHALAHASLLYGESATMASECAVLGTPSIYIDDEGRGYTDEQEEKYGMVYNFDESEISQKKSIDKAKQILEISNSHDFYKIKRENMINEKIDFTEFLVSYFENYFIEN